MPTGDFSHIQQNIQQIIQKLSADYFSSYGNVYGDDFEEFINKIAKEVEEKITKKIVPMHPSPKVCPPPPSTSTDNVSDFDADQLEKLKQVFGDSLKEQIEEDLKNPVIYPEKSQMKLSQFAKTYKLKIEMVFDPTAEFEDTYKARFQNSRIRNKDITGFLEGDDSWGFGLSAKAALSDYAEKIRGKVVESNGKRIFVPEGMIA